MIALLTFICWAYVAVLVVAVVVALMALAITAGPERTKPAPPTFRAPTPRAKGSAPLPPRNAAGRFQAAPAAVLEVSP